MTPKGKVINNLSLSWAFEVVMSLSLGPLLGDSISCLKEDPFTLSFMIHHVFSFSLDSISLSRSRWRWKDINHKMRVKKGSFLKVTAYRLTAHGLWSHYRLCIICDHDSPVTALCQPLGTSSVFMVSFPYYNCWPFKTHHKLSIPSSGFFLHGRKISDVWGSWQRLGGNNPESYTVGLFPVSTVRTRINRRHLYESLWRPLETEGVILGKDLICLAEDVTMDAAGFPYGRRNNGQPLHPCNI